ncbi:MAG: DUF885 family protein [Phycisphaerales bacterium]|nr:DUF885 family protein [Phycisphaerales bacterium]
MKHRLVASIVLAALTGIASAQSSLNELPPAGGDLRDMINLVGEDTASLARWHSIRWSDARWNDMESLARTQMSMLGRVNFDSLSRQGKIDYVLLRNELRGSLSQAARHRARITEMKDLLPFKDAVIAFEGMRWRMEQPEPRTSAGTLAGFAADIKKVRERIEKGRHEEKKETSPADATQANAASSPPPAPDAPIVLNAVQAQRAAGAVSEFRRVLADWYEYHAPYTPEFSWWCKKPFEEARAALDDYERYLRQDIAGLKGAPDDPLVGNPIGRDWIIDDLKLEFVAYTPEQLIAIADREFAWCEARMKEAARDMGLGEDWKAALEKVKNITAPAGHQTDMMAELTREGIEFVKKHDLVTIPEIADKYWRLEMISPENQRFWPFAFYGGQTIGVAAPADSMSHDAKLQSMRGNNRHFSRIVVPHELIPGHHLQGFMASRVRPYRGTFTTPFFVEGWALYWEMKFWDMNFAESPEDRVGMLFWRMHRCARIIISLKYHLGEMTPQQMIDFLVDRVGHERDNATSEVRRYIGPDYAPLYQAAYMLGGLALRSLHEEAVTKGGMKERDFNDALLTYGAIPIELVRAGILNTPLARDSEPVWNFAGDIGDRK